MVVSLAWDASSLDISGASWLSASSVPPFRMVTFLGPVVLRLELFCFLLLCFLLLFVLGFAPSALSGFAAVGGATSLGFDSGLSDEGVSGADDWGACGA